MVSLNNHFGIQRINALNFRDVATPPAPNYANLAPLEKDTFIKNETIKKERKSENGSRVVEEFDPKTGKMIRSMQYQKDGKTVDMIDEYDPQTGNKIKNTWFYNDGKTIKSIHEFNPLKLEFLSGAKWFKEDGKTIDWIDEFDPTTGNPSKTISYREDGKTVWGIDEYDTSILGRVVKSTRFKEDGKTIDKIINFDPKTGEEIKTNG